MAKWMPTGEYECVDEIEWYECTKCHKVLAVLENDNDWYEPNFCPHCGTRFGGEEDNDQ